MIQELICAIILGVIIALHESYKEFPRIASEQRPKKPDTNKYINAYKVRNWMELFTLCFIIYSMYWYYMESIHKLNYRDFFLPGITGVITYILKDLLIAQNTPNVKWWYIEAGKSKGDSLMNLFYKITALFALTIPTLF